MPNLAKQNLLAVHQTCSIRFTLVLQQRRAKNIKERDSWLVLQSSWILASFSDRAVLRVKVSCFHKICSVCEVSSWLVIHRNLHHFLVFWKRYVQFFSWNDIYMKMMDIFHILVYIFYRIIAIFLYVDFLELARYCAMTFEVWMK